VRQSLGDFVIVEPTLTERTNPNKQWGRAKWQELTRILNDNGYRIVQIGPNADDILDGSQFIETPTFRVGAAVLQHSIGAILPEGGLHHAAGMLRKRVVVLFGGAVDVNATGYEDHINIVRGDACGNWLHCDHCKEIWAALQPREVADRFIDSLSPTEK
jgi:ADP-heptose:LPS heptosyltransferase